MRSRNTADVSSWTLGIIDLNEGVGNIPVCDIPTNLSFSLSGTAPNVTATATWSLADSAVNSRYEWRTAASGTNIDSVAWSGGTTISGTTTRTATRTGLAALTRVQFRVAAVCSDALGQSEWVEVQYLQLAFRNFLSLS